MFRQRHEGDEGADSGDRAATSYANALAARTDGHHHDERKWLERAAEAGHPQANYDLATKALAGTGPTVKNIERMGVAAAAGLPDALYELGAFFDRTNPSDKPPRPDRDPFPPMRRAADAGQPKAIRWLGIEAGHALDATEFVSRLRASVAAGDGHTDIGWLDDPDLDDLARTADERDAEAMDRFARRVRPHTTRYLYVPWFHAAANLDHPGATCEMAEILELRKLESKDQITARYRKAADLGSGRAMLKLGDRVRAEDRQDWYRKAADAGDPDAFARLGDKAHRDAPDDPTEANRLWMEGVSRGSGDAMWSLCNYALNHHDEAGRADWERRAAEAGNITALQVMIKRTSDDAARATWQARLATALPCDPPSNSSGSGEFGGLFDLLADIAIN